MKLKSTDEAVMSLDELRASPGYPDEDAFQQGPIAVIECIEEIPCDPCEAACRSGAIHVGDRIIDLPQLRPEKCNGCRRCISICPGLAVFVVDKTYSETEATVSIPYEFLSLPSVGDVVSALDRQGEPVCQAKVLRVDDRERNDLCRVVTIVIPKEHADVVRGITVGR